MSSSSPSPDLESASGDPAASRAADRLAFSLWIPAAVAATVCFAVGLVLEARDVGRWAVIAATGSFVVYGIDRLRDLPRDRDPSPRRTEFIERNVIGFRVALGLALISLVPAAAGASREALALCAALGGLGLLHRRLKRVPAIKSVYVSTAWTGICVGLPWLDTTGDPSTPGLWAVAILFPAFWSNLVASNLRDDEAALDPTPALRLARAAAAAAVTLALFAPPPLRVLGWIPAAELLALLRFRPTEHYGHLAIDGALAAGALAALAQHSLT